MANLGPLFYVLCYIAIIAFTFTTVVTFAAIWKLYRSLHNQKFMIVVLSLQVYMVLTEIFVWSSLLAKMGY